MALHWLRASTAEEKGVKAASLTALPKRSRSTTEARTASTLCPISSMPYNAISPAASAAAAG
uniref:Uncharacterized protein n=1 Tax=Oryza barthii TaxID=65489 RepID=A0A0D3FIH9_9ORYZ